LIQWRSLSPLNPLRSTDYARIDLARQEDGGIGRPLFIIIQTNLTFSRVNVVTRNEMTALGSSQMTRDFSNDSYGFGLDRTRWLKQSRWDEVALQFNSWKFLHQLRGTVAISWTPR